jgi:hypothetical protein
VGVILVHVYGCGHEGFWLEVEEDRG